MKTVEPAGTIHVWTTPSMTWYLVNLNVYSEEGKLVEYQLTHDEKTGADCLSGVSNIPVLLDLLEQLHVITAPDVADRILLLEAKWEVSRG